MWIASRRVLAPLAPLIAGLVTPAHADFQLLPQNGHQLYQTYALRNDQQTSFEWAGAGRSYGSLGGTIALAGLSDTDLHPQLVFMGSLQAAMVFSTPNNGGMGADELDLNLGAAVEFSINSMMRASIGFLHLSGHSTEDTLDRSLLGMGVSDNIVFGRFVYDLGPYVRAGLTFSPIVQGTPSPQTFAADQFVEVFPWAGLDEQQRMSPYVAASLSENGTAQFGNQVSFHAQAGVYFGNHFSHEYKPTLRPVVGFYTGAAPELKYFQLRGTTRTFGYVGLMLDL